MGSSPVIRTNEQTFGFARYFCFFAYYQRFWALPTFIQKRFNRYFLSELHSITHIIYRQEIAITNHRHEFITEALYYAWLTFYTFKYCFAITHFLTCMLTCIFVVFYDILCRFLTHTLWKFQKEKSPKSLIYQQNQGFFMWQGQKDWVSPAGSVGASEYLRYSEVSTGHPHPSTRSACLGV